MVSQTPDRPRVREIVADPHWLIRDVLTAFIIGAMLAAGSVIGTKLVDDRRAERELNAVLVANRHDLQLENLRFVRSRSLDVPDAARRFAELDLAGQNLVGLPLPGSDFARADLTGANLSEADLSRANFARAALQGANLTRTDLRGAYFGPERIPDAPDREGADLTDADLTDADLTGADLRHADLTGATLTRATLTDISYDSDTVWPQGFAAPPPKP